jgi:aerobic-type carbon monoxide dehydrogenase small subunit (CoxS/CutS family)
VDSDVPASWLADLVDDLVGPAVAAEASVTPEAGAARGRASQGGFVLNDRERRVGKGAPGGSVGDDGAVRVNASAVSLDEVPANWTVADLIRYRTTLRGTHLACEHGVCGVCTVLLDGEPVRSCLTLSHAVRGRQVTTVEGLDLVDAALSERLRAAFLSRNAFQCGFCTPGMLALVFAAARAARVDAGSTPAARELIDANICRCTGYSAIVAAAADVLEELDPPEPAGQAER